jgi:hypothetical protein
LAGFLFCQGMIFNKREKMPGQCYDTRFFLFRFWKSGIRIKKQLCLQSEHPQQQMLNEKQIWRFKSVYLRKNIVCAYSLMSPGLSMLYFAFTVLK